MYDGLSIAGIVGLFTLIMCINFVCYYFPTRLVIAKAGLGRMKFRFYVLGYFTQSFALLLIAAAFANTRHLMQF